MATDGLQLELARQNDSSYQPHENEIYQGHARSDPIFGHSKARPFLALTAHDRRVMILDAKSVLSISASGNLDE
jgi:hypothetical protein